MDGIVTEFCINMQSLWCCVVLSNMSESNMLLKNSKLSKPLIGAAVALALYGCGGGGSSSDGATGGAQSLSGQAADGYLMNANVCLDVNDNKVCDQGEPTAVTGTNGSFTLTGLTQAEIDAHGIVVEVVKNITIDQDNPGTPIDGEYSLTAPVGYTFVSPISTMVKSELDNQNTENLEDAEKAIKDLLGLDINPQTDYVAKKQSTDATEQKAYKQLHQVAQVAADIMKRNTADFEANPSAEDGITEQEKLEWISEQVAENLQTIATTIIETDDVDAPITQIISAVDTEVQIDVTNAKSEIEVKRELQVASATEVFNVVKSDGVYSYSAWHNDSYLRAFYHNFKLAASSDVSGAYVEAGVEYQYNGSTWDQRTDSGNNFILTSDGWKDVNEDFIITVDDVTGVVSLTHPTYSEIKEQFVANKILLAGKDIAATLRAADFRTEKWSKFVQDASPFSSDSAAGYQMDFIQLYDRYELWQHTCDSQQLQEGVCYQVWLGGETGGYAETMQDLFSSVAATTPSQAKGPYVAYGDGNNVYAEIVSDSNKTVNFYAVPSDSNSNGTLYATGNWELRTVSGAEILVVYLPPSVRRLSDDVDVARIFAMSDYADGVNLIHSGEFEPNLTQESQEMIFNKAAHDEILNAFSHANFCEVQAATVQGTSGTSSSECS